MESLFKQRVQTLQRVRFMKPNMHHVRLESLSCIKLQGTPVLKILWISVFQIGYITTSAYGGSQFFMYEQLQEMILHILTMKHAMS